MCTHTHTHTHVEGCQLPSLTPTHRNRQQQALARLRGQTESATHTHSGSHTHTHTHTHMEVVYVHYPIHLCDCVDNHKYVGGSGGTLLHTHTHIQGGPRIFSCSSQCIPQRCPRVRARVLLHAGVYVYVCVCVCQSALQSRPRRDAPVFRPVQGRQTCVCVSVSVCNGVCGCPCVHVYVCVSSHHERVEDIHHDSTCGQQHQASEDKRTDGVNDKPPT